jgi:hypothetical protein
MEWVGAGKIKTQDSGLRTQDSRLKTQDSRLKEGYLTHHEISFRHIIYHLNPVERTLWLPQLSVTVSSSL